MRELHLMMLVVAWQVRMVVVVARRRNVPRLRVPMEMLSCRSGGSRSCHWVGLRDLLGGGSAGVRVCQAIRILS